MTQTLLKSERAEWLEQRKKGIGGSDAATVCLKVVYKGKPYEKTIIDLYNEKLGAEQPESKSIAMDLGNILEPYVCERFISENPEWELQRSVDAIHPEYDFIRGSFDGILTHKETGEKAILEVKTADSTMKAKWDDQIPVNYYLQQQHYLMFPQFEFKRSFTAVLFGNREYDQYEVPRDESLQKEMINVHYIPFWNCVKSATPPPLEGDAVTLNSVKKMFPEAKKSGIFLPRECEMLIYEYLKTSKQLKELEEVKESCQAQIIAYLGEAEGGMIDNYIVTYKNRMGIDIERLKEEQPETFQRYAELELNTTEFNKKEKELSKNYKTVSGRTFGIKEK